MTDPNQPQPQDPNQPDPNQPQPEQPDDGGDQGGDGERVRR